MRSEVRLSNKEVVWIYLVQAHLVGQMFKPRPYVQGNKLDSSSHQKGFYPLNVDPDL